MIEFVNLSRGLLCGPSDGRIMRLQSTWCEQREWDRILMTTSPELYFRLAQGHKIVVHDLSEKRRETRAQWQGLSWIRAATSLAWYQVTPTEFSRNGMNITDYWVKQFGKLDKTTKTYVRRFAEWTDPYTQGVLSPCSCWQSWPYRPLKEIYR